jgi:hypothetical protein
MFVYQLIYQIIALQFNLSIASVCRQHFGFCSCMLATVSATGWLAYLVSWSSGFNDTQVLRN